MNPPERVTIHTESDERRVYDKAWIHENGKWVTGWIDTPSGRIKEVFPRDNVRSIQYPNE